MIYDLVLICDETDVEMFDIRNRPMSAKFIHNLYRKPIICLQQCETKVYCHTDYYGWTSDWTKQPALTRVSREVRAETLPIYYKKNEFVAFSSYRGPGFGDLEATRQYLSSIGSQNAGLIKHLTFLFPYAEHFVDIDGEEVRRELHGEGMGLARAAVQLFEGGTFGNIPKNPHGYEPFGWGYQGEESKDSPEYQERQRVELMELGV